MYLWKNQADELMHGHMQDLLSTLRGQMDFLSSLRDGDDWSFTIKAQALIEGAVTQSVLNHLGDQRIRKTVEVMPLVGGEVSKLALTKDLGLLNSVQRRFVKRMASLRNRMAHSIDYTNFEFTLYVASLDRDALKDWQESIVWFTDDRDARDIWQRLAITQPRATVFLGVSMLVALLTIDGSEKEMMRKIDEAAYKTTSEFLNRSPAIYT
jgi:hypothetical protein